MFLSCRNMGFYIQAAFMKAFEGTAPKLKPHCPACATACSMSPDYSPVFPVLITSRREHGTVELTAPRNLPAWKQNLTNSLQTFTLGCSFVSPGFLMGIKCLNSSLLLLREKHLCSRFCQNRSCWDVLSISLPSDHPFGILPFCGCSFVTPEI